MDRKAQKVYHRPVMLSTLTHGPITCRLLPRSPSREVIDCLVETVQTLLKLAARPMSQSAELHYPMTANSLSNF